MSEYFSDAPSAESLTSSQAEVLGELRKMLDMLRPAQVLADQTSAKAVGKGALDIHIPHRDRPDESLWVTVSRKDIAVGFAHGHLHFFPEKDPEWLEDALHFIWDLLRGQVEVEITFKGRVKLKTRVFRVDDAGSRHLLETAGDLLPFNPFAKKSVERHVPRFVS